MKKVIINEIEYELVKDVKSCFKLDEVEERVTDYFQDYDYIFGDYSYGKVRLKGFNDRQNKNFRTINDISTLDKYISDFCAYGAKYFLLKKVK